MLKNVLSRTQIRECFMPDYGAIVKMQAKLYERGEIEQGAIVKRVNRHLCVLRHAEDNHLNFAKGVMNLWVSV